MNTTDEVKGFFPSIIWVITKMPIFMCSIMLLITGYLFQDWYNSDVVFMRSFEFSQLNEPIIYWPLIFITGLIVLLMFIAIFYRLVVQAKRLYDNFRT